MADTGFLARNLAGFNYDLNEETGERTEGGIYPDGPHQQMVEFLDAPGTRKLLLASRGSRKTTLAIAFCLRLALRNPNIRIAYGVETFKTALKRLKAIRWHFESNARLKEAFGDLRGDPWRVDEFTLNSRTLPLVDPTFSAFGTDQPITGSHFDVVIWDDPISWQLARAPEQLEKVQDAFAAMVPLLDPTAQFIIIGTPYDESDLYHYIQNDVRGWDVLKLDCGMFPVKDASGRLVLTGTPRFPHLTEKHLQRALDEMQEQFPAQYCLQVQNPTDQIFFREDFRVPDPPLDYDAMRGKRCYLLTDSAVSDADTACLSVLAMVVLDWNDDTYLLDLDCGLWTPDEFVTHAIDVLARWNAIGLRVSGVVLENTALNKALGSNLSREATKRGLWLPLVGVPRGTGLPSKNQRIRGLSPRFRRGQFYVGHDVPRTWMDRGKPRLLWDPYGFKDGDKQLPDGELVRQFINFRMSGSAGRVDIADALADLDAIDQQGRRIVTPSAKPRPEDVQSKPKGARILPMPRQPRAAPPRRSFWDDLKRRVR